MIKTIFLFLLFSTSVFAAQKIVLKDGEVSFLAIGKPSFLKVNGKGTAAQGELNLKETQASGIVTFDLQTLTTGIALRDQHMKEKYLNTPQYPVSSLKLSNLALSKDLLTKEKSSSKINFKGDLTLNGVTKSISGDMDISKDGNLYQVQSHFKLQLSDFNIQVPKYMGITIADEVSVDVTSKSELINIK